MRTQPATAWWPVETQVREWPEWRQIIDTAASVLRAWEEMQRRCAGAKQAPPPQPPDPDGEARSAAALLGVSLHATIPEIRAALRAKLMASGAHPDHGGDGEQAKRMIATRDLLVARVDEKRGER